MVCKCGHNKKNHQTRRDDWPERNGGQCDGIEIGNTTYSCSCSSYERLITFRGSG